MERPWNIIFAGFGGQGVLFTGKIVATAGLIDGREVSWLSSYGPEMRGGTAHCSVCLSDEAIGSPLVISPDILMAMNTPSYEMFTGEVVPGGVVTIDESLAQAITVRDDVTMVRLPETHLSNEHGLQGIANMILLGGLLTDADLMTDEATQKAVAKCVPAKRRHLLEHNLWEVNLGKELAGKPA